VGGPITSSLDKKKMQKSMQRFQWTQRAGLFVWIGGLVGIVVAVLLVLTFIGVPNDNKHP
jgi:ABC-type antimicrobial peptide transport system permease subunit